jgi:hypothetical protein
VTGLPRQLQLGDHCCQFFETVEDLGDLLVPYFKEGLERNEACLWVTNEPYGKERARSEMCAATAGFDPSCARGQIEILSGEEWYSHDGRVDFDALLLRLLGKMENAIAAGYTGLRATGNVSFVEPEYWTAFLDYERNLTKACQSGPLAAVCSYCLSECDAERVFEAIDTHNFALRKRKRHWDVFGLRDARLTAHLQGMELRDLVEDRLAVHRRFNPNRIRIEGPRVLLSAQQSHDLGLLFHELTASAAKYGALWVPEGKLDVRWRVILNGVRRLQIEWVETGAKDLLAQNRPQLAAQFAGETVEKWVQEFKPAGMVCTFEVTLD